MINNEINKFVYFKFMITYKKLKIGKPCILYLVKNKTFSVAAHTGISHFLSVTNGYSQSFFFFLLQSISFKIDKREKKKKILGNCCPWLPRSTCKRSLTIWNWRFGENYPGVRKTLINL